MVERGNGGVGEWLGWVVPRSAALRCDPAGGRFQFVENHPWIPTFGTGYILGLDGIHTMSPRIALPSLVRGRS